jgi:hypothetical protein
MGHAKRKIFFYCYVVQGENYAGILPVICWKKRPPTARHSPSGLLGDAVMPLRGVRLRAIVNLSSSSTDRSSRQSGV